MSRPLACSLFGVALPNIIRKAAPMPAKSCCGAVPLQDTVIVALLWDMGVLTGRVSGVDPAWSSGLGVQVQDEHNMVGAG